MVVSLTNISPAHGSRYYASESGTDSEPKSQWSGKLASVLGLNQQTSVDPTAFDYLLQGRHPEGRVLINKMRLAHESVSGSPRAGVDLITSAPKSISLQSLVFGDQRLAEAHQQATRLMLQILEDRYAITRIHTEGQRRKVTTGNLLVAQFTHPSSRDLDPHLHTHNIILNLTRRSDGRWSSLDNEQIYRHKFLLDKIYQNELLRAVHAMGYAVSITNTQHGLWELQGFTPQQLEQFSKRSHHIQAVAGADADERARERVALYSDRPKKQSISVSQLQHQWQQEGHAMRMQALVPSPSFANQENGSRENLNEVIQQAIAHCAQRTPQFSREAIEVAALTRAIGQYLFSTLTCAVDQFPELIPSLDNLTVQYRLGDSYAIQLPAWRNHHGIPTGEAETRASRNDSNSSSAQITSTSHHPSLHLSSSTASRQSNSGSWTLHSSESNSSCSSNSAADSSPAAAIERASSPPQTPAAELECHLPPARRVYFRSQRLDEPAEAALEGTQPSNRSDSSAASRAERDQSPAEEIAVIPPLESQSDVEWQLER
jgi:conjugative relaxase-like TrwC/TraI family protein